jgi:hypothetical protein
MLRKLSFILMASVFVIGIGSTTAPAAAESIVGTWAVMAESPNGSMELQFVFRMEGGQLSGMVSSPQGSMPMSAVKFEDPNLTIDLAVNDNTYKITGLLKDGVLEGTWERTGTESKGRWTAKPVVEATASTAPAAGGIIGSWDSVATTPNGDLPAVMEIKQDGGKFSGQIVSDMGSIPLQAVTFMDNQFQFDITLGDNTYRVKAALSGDKLDGGWAPSAGGEGGPWKATRKAAAATPAAVNIPAPIEGSWDATAQTPEGEMRFVLEVKNTSGTLSGAMTAQDGSSTPMQKPVFADNRLSFVVDYMGGTYRVEATLADGKLAGKWFTVGGGDSGTLTATRKN